MASLSEEQKPTANPLFQLLQGKYSHYYETVTKANGIFLLPLNKTLERDKKENTEFSIEFIESHCVLPSSSGYMTINRKNVIIEQNQVIVSKRKM